jgi:hypothetical protein
MLIKVHTDIIIDVKDKEEGEEACHTLNMGLESQLRNFPHGEVVDANVDTFEMVNDREAREQGWLE